MYSEHPTFTPPSNPHIGLWRYMDLPKLISLLTSSALWFARADRLGDRHEGAVGPLTAQLREFHLRSITWSQGVDQEKIERLIASQSTTAEAWTRYTFINCWHMNEVESVAMWRAYGGLGSPVCIKSSFARLAGSLEGEEPCYVGEVRYVDTNTDIVSYGDVFGPFTHKRSAFSYERELRAVVPRFPVTNEAIDFSQPSPAGILVPTRLSSLIEAVYVGPDQLPWFHETVRSAVAAFAPEVEIRKSALDTDPIF